MGFKLIDVSKWNRKEHYDHYLNQVPCSYSMTLNLELTSLIRKIKKLDIKLYPTMIYLLSKVVNCHDEFRMAIDSKGQIGVFDLLFPSYTLFQKDTETFTNVWTEYTDSFSVFYERYLLDVNNYGTIKNFEAKSNAPANVFNISSIPWVSFTGFNLNLPKATTYLLPIFTMGKYFEQNGKLLLPFAIQVHHAACDGFHLARFVNDLQGNVNSFFEI